MILPALTPISAAVSGRPAGCATLAASRVNAWMRSLWLSRHLLIIDCTNKNLYELYNVYYNPAQAKWYAGSGAFFDMNTNNRRPDTWTSADAAGLAILVFVFGAIWASRYTKVGPNQALVISGRIFFSRSGRASSKVLVLRSSTLMMW